MSDTFSYRRQGRRPAVWLAAGCLGFVASAGMMNGAPYPLWIMWLLGGLPVVWVILTNPTDGMMIDRDALVLSPWRKPLVVPRDSIDHVRVRGQAGLRDVTLVLRSGDPIEVNPRDLPDGTKLRHAFRQFGLQVLEV